jgi:amino acid permease
MIDDDAIKPRSNSFRSSLLPQKDSNNKDNYLKHSENILRSSTKCVGDENFEAKIENIKINNNKDDIDEDNNSKNNEKIIDETGTSSDFNEKTKEIEILFKDPDLIDTIDIDNNELIFNTSSLQKLMVKIGLNSLGRIIISLSLINIYVSSLNLSQRMVHSSIYIYPILIIVIGIFSHWTLNIMLKISDKYKKKILFKKARPIYIFFVIINCIGNIILEEIILYKIIYDIIIKFDESKSEYLSQKKIKYYSFSGIALILLFPIFQFTNIQYFRKFLIFELIVLLIFSLILISNYTLLFIRNYDLDFIKSKLTIELDYFLYPDNEFLNSIVVLFYCFSNHDNFLQLFENMRDPSSKRINKIITTTTCIDIIIYLLMASIGFFSLPIDEIQDLIIIRNDIEKGYINDWIMTLGRIIYIICLLIKLLKDYYKIRNIILTKICRCSAKKIGTCVNIIISLFILFITTLISIYFQNISDCICLIGAFCSAYISFIIPLLLYIIENEYSFCHTKNFFVSLLIVIIFIISTGSLFFTVKKIKFSYKKD